MHRPILDDIAARRKLGVGYNPHTFVELFDGEIVEMIWHEPDPLTFRRKYYYNTRLDQLFRKVEVKDFAYWKRISEIQE